MMSEKRRAEIRSIINAAERLPAPGSMSILLSALKDLEAELTEAQAYHNSTITDMQRLLAAKDQEIKARDRLITKNLGGKLVQGRRTTR